MLFDAWFAPPVPPRVKEAAASRDEAPAPRPAALSYRPPIRAPRFVWGLLPHTIGLPPTR